MTRSAKWWFPVSLLVLLGCRSEPLDAEALLQNIDRHQGRRITVRAQFRSGARCRLETSDGEWKTYCGDCQYCRGPVVLDTPTTRLVKDPDKWPLVVGGAWKQKPIGCEGKLNEVTCYPFEPGKTYVVQGVIQDQRPPKLLVYDVREE